MMTIARLLAPALAAAAILAVVGTNAEAQCNTIGGKGTAGSVESAKFQAYEAMLQGTDWGMWATWMASGAKVGEAPGYTVRGLRFKCGPDAWGAVCRGQATLCKKA